MKRRIAFLTAAAVVVVSGPVSALDGIDGSGGALQGAGRLDNQKQVDDPVEPAPQLSAELQVVLDLTNSERQARGMSPLVLDQQLTDAAVAHSQDQAARGLLTHSGSDGSTPGQRIARTGYSFRTWAENAAAGYRTGASVMNGWMNSPGHRANILNPNMTEIGLGIAFTSSGYAYWTQVFAAPR